MGFKNGISETSEATETKGEGSVKFSDESSNKFDEIMGDDKISTSEVDEKPQLSPEERETKYNGLFESGSLQIEETNKSADIKHERGEGLTEDEKEDIKKKEGWSDIIVNSLGSVEEYQIYKNAGLKEDKIGDKICLIRGDIDWNQVDEKGRTNQQRAEQGLAPLDKNGNAIQLHHIGQHADSPLAELTFEEHRCGGNDTILHDKSKETETHGEGNNWDNERQDYWKNRGEYNLEGGNLNG